MSVEDDVIAIRCPPGPRIATIADHKMLRCNIKAVFVLCLWSDCIRSDPRAAMFVLATAIMLVFGAILAWDLAGQPTKLRHFRRLLGLKSRRKR